MRLVPAMRVVRSAATIAILTSAAVPLSVGVASADGKSVAGCAGGYTLVSYNDQGQLIVVSTGLPEARTEAGLESGTFNPAASLALFEALDHNGDNMLCYKLPNGWTSGNTDNRTYYVNLVDDKVV